MRTIVVYVVWGIVIVPAFVETVNIEKYRDTFVIYNISESFASGSPNYIGLMIYVAKLDTKYFWEIKRLWFHMVPQQ